MPVLPRTTTLDTKTAAAIVQQTTGLSDAEHEELDRISQRGGGVDVVAGRVRSAHLRVLSRILQHQLGESGMARIVAERPELGAPLSPTLAPLVVVDARGAGGGAGGGEQGAAAGAGGAEGRPRDDERDVRAPVRRGPDVAAGGDCFGGAAEFWPRYHDWGDVDVTVQPGTATVLLHGYPGSTEVCAMIAAELERIVELTGASAVGAVHTACRCVVAGERCEFKLSWAR